MENKAEEKKAIRHAALAARDAIPTHERIARSRAACIRIERFLAERFEHRVTDQATNDSEKLETDRTKNGRETNQTAQGEQTGGGAGEGRGADCFQLSYAQPPFREGAVKGAGADCATKKEERLRIQPPLVAVYFAMKSEVDLAELVRACFARAWDVCFPCMMKEPQPLPMEFYSVTSNQLSACTARKGNAATGENEHSSFPRNPLQRFAPKELERLGFHRINPRDIDAIIVPLTAFDSRGNRLGYGGGNYDRYLPLLREGTAVIGAAFGEQQVEAVPTEPHDLPLPLIVKA